MGSFGVGEGGDNSMDFLRCIMSNDNDECYRRVAVEPLCFFGVVAVFYYLHRNSRSRSLRYVA